MSTDPLALSAGVPDGPDVYRFHTVDGVSSADAFRIPELLLLRSLHDNNPGDHLSVQANYGVVGVSLAASADSVLMTEASARRATCCRRNATENDADAGTAVLAELRRLDQAFDTASYAPESHTPIAVGKQRIADALATLQPGGRLFVAATDAVGRSRYRDCLTALTGGCRRALDKDGCSVLVAERPHDYHPPRYVTPTRYEPTVEGVSLPLVSVPGLFAAGRLDDGTRLLARTARIEDGDRVLDLCCGAGPLGVYAGRVADCEVTLSDDSRVATRAAACSLRAAGVDGTVVTADGVAGVVDQRFDRVLCNPPTHAGEGVLTAVLDGARRVLTERGELLVVHHRALDLQQHLRGVGQIETRATGPEHVVVSATNASSPDAESKRSAPDGESKESAMDSASAPSRDSSSGPCW